MASERAVTLFVMLCLLCASCLAIKKVSFITSDGISHTFGVTQEHSIDEETYAYSSLWITKPKFIMKKRQSKSLIFLLLIISGDIESCPGPHTCTCCDKTIRKNQKSSFCYACKAVCHRKCTIDELINGKEYLFCSLCHFSDPERDTVDFLDSTLTKFLKIRGLKIFHQNLNGLSGKLEKVKLFLECKQVHIFCITETHISNSVRNCDLNIPGYTFERRDRENGPHGGVLCYIREDLIYQRRPDLNTEGIECIWIEIIIPNTKSVLVSTIYKPPENSKYTDRNFNNKLENMLSMVTTENKDCIITGDLNCNYLVPRDQNVLKNVFSTNGFTQIIKQATRTTSVSKTLIDVIMVTDETKVADSIVYSNSFSDHDLIGFVFKKNTKKYNPRRISARDYKRYDKESFKTELRNTAWEICLIQNDANSAWNLFKTMLTNVINKHAPPIERTIRGQPSVWFTKEIKTKMNTRDYYLRVAKRTNKKSDWSTYKRLRNRVSCMIRQAKANYIRSTFREKRTHPKQFWNQIKKSFPTKRSEPSAKSFLCGNQTTSDNKEISNEFCSFFATVGSKLASTIKSFSNRTWLPFNGFKYLSRVNPLNRTFKFRIVEIPETLKILKNIRASKSSGPDDLPASMITDAAEELAAPLTFLINTCFKSGVFPTAEKTSKVTPIYKSGEKKQFTNYRPISVLNVVSKVIEKLAFNQLADYFENNDLLTNSQYGFRRNRSTQHAVTTLVDHIRLNMDKGNYTGVLYMDFSKAFDTVNHSCLIHKLPFYGITGTELEWIIDYLFNRDQFVNFNGSFSKSEKITHGVPQGSILGPLLFIILINDIQLQLKNCSMLMYADDTVVYFSGKSTKEIEQTINEEAEKISQWINENCLILNLKKGKTEFVLYGSKMEKYKCDIIIEQTQINQPSSYEYLGVTLDKHLNLGDHYSKVSKKISSRIKLLNKVRHQISPSVAETIYNVIIKPMFLYCSNIFLGQSTMWTNSFENLHSRAKRIIGESTKSWPSIAVQHKRKISVDVFKCIHGIDANTPFPKYEVISHSINTRGNKSMIRLPKIKSEAGRKSSYYQGAYIFNSMSGTLRNETSLANFKRNIKLFNFDS